MSVISFIKSGCSGPTPEDMFGDMITRDSDTIIQYLAGISIFAIGLAETMDLARDEGISQEELIMLSRAFEGIKPLERGFIRGLKGEHDLVSEIIESIVKGDHTHIKDDVTGSVKFLLEFNSAVGYFLQPNRTKKIHADNTRKVIENVGRCYAEMEIDGIHESINDPIGTPDVIRHLPRPNPAGRALIPVVSAPHNRILKETLRTETHISATHLITALRVYKRAEETVPKRLKELVPDYIDTIPRDPFDGQPFRYNPSLDVVYSVGKDMQDHGGRPVMFKDDPWWSRLDDYFVYEVGINVEAFQKEVEKFALSEEEPELRAGAVSKLLDQEVLTHFALEDSARVVRREAVSRLDVREVLERIAEEDEAPSVRHAARERLSEVGP